MCVQKSVMPVLKNAKNIVINIESIGEESKKHPYSDEKLTEMLQEKGYNIARRTVEKLLPVERIRPPS